MYIIHENELIHVDNGSDVLEHYGVKGMKWGKRVSGYMGALAKAQYNKFRHPILSQKAAVSASGKSKWGHYIGTKRSLDYKNKFVDAHVKAKKQNKLAKKEFRKDLQDGYSKYSKLHKEARKSGKGIDKVVRSWDAHTNAAHKKYKKKLVDRKNINIKY